MVENVFVLMPAYNAAATVEKVFARVPPEARRRIRRYVAVNDGSKDDTAAVLARLQKEFDSLVVLTHPVNRGYGEAEKTLLRYALAEGAEVGIVLHSDGQYSPEKIVDLLEPFDRGTADMVQGSRMLGGGALRGGMPFYKFAGNRALTTIENLAFGMKLAEYHSGYMLYSRKALETIPFEKLSASFDFDLEMLVLAHVKGLRIAEVAIPTIYAGEKSHLNPIKYGLDVLSVVREYRRGKYHAM
ncbi:MAG TPA: glycosyltransferase family 2 protein [Bryobacteraceae bacterium]|jgi:glycosyltransferase involved in cell wall biosynthesis|nr:glycosyltransferase family 2 protein [Bryobacteraceae bacterium]